MEHQSAVYWAVLLSFKGWFNLEMFIKYGWKHLVAQGLTQSDKAVEFSSFVKDLEIKGLTLRHPSVPGFLMLHPLMFAKSQPSRIRYRKKIILSLLNYYDNYATGIDLVVKDVLLEKQQTGVTWAILELSNLWYTHKTALQQNRVVHSFFTLAGYYIRSENNTDLEHLLSYTLVHLNKMPKSCRGISFFVSKSFLLKTFGDLAEQKKDYELAENLYDEMLYVLTESNKKFDFKKIYEGYVYDGQVQIGVAHLGFGNIATRKNNYKKALIHFEEARNIFQKYKEKALLIRAFNMLGSVEYYTRNHKKSHVYYQKALKLSGSQNPADVLQQARILLNSGQNLYSMKQFKKAEAQLSLSLKISRQSGQKESFALASLALGNLHFDMENLSHARIAYHEALKQFMLLGDQFNEAICFQNMAHISALEANTEEAEEYFLKSHSSFKTLQENSHLSETAHNLGSLYYNQQDYTKAEEWLKVALEFSSLANKQTDVGEIWLKTGLVAIQKKDWEVAVTSLEKSVTHLKTEKNTELLAEAFSYAGFAYLKSDKWEMARNCYQSALSIYKSKKMMIKQARMHLGLGRTLFVLHKDSDSVKNLVKSYHIFVKYGMEKETEEIHDTLQRMIAHGLSGQTLLKYASEMNLSKLLT